MTIVLATAGYPEAPRSGDVITGIEAAEAQPGVQVFQAGTVRNQAGNLCTSGGRVLTVTGLGANVRQAREAAYRGADCITFAGKQVRRDIASSVV